MIARSLFLTDAFDNATKHIQLGYSQTPRAKIGFQVAKTKSRDIIEVSDELPILTFAPTGRGKGVSSIIPTLLTNNRPMVVMDPKGENFAVTARRRREMGHAVYALDPFKLMAKKSDSLNPMDLMKLPGVSVESEAVMLAETIGHDFQSKKEAFWDQHALGLTAGLIALAASGHYPDNLTTVRDHLVGEDPIHKIAVALDLLAEKNLKETMAFRELSALLNQSERETRPSVLASAGTYAKIFNAERVAKTIEKSTIKLKDLVNAKPVTVFIIIPSNKLHSHRALVRLWLSTIMAAIQSRTDKPANSTLFLIDECGHLGGFDLLKTAVTLCRGFGIQPWLFFQSLYQLKENFGEGWRTVIDNAGVVQAFGFANRFGSAEWGDFFGRAPKQLLSMAREDQLLFIQGTGTVESRRLNYLKDPQYEGLYDSNPYFVRSQRMY